MKDCGKVFKCSHDKHPMKSVLFYLQAKGYCFFFFYCRCSSGPLDGSKYIQGQSQCQCFFFLFCRIQTQLTCRFWVSLAELATDCWINKNVLEFTQPRNIYMTFSDLDIYLFSNFCIFGCRLLWLIWNLMERVLLHLIWMYTNSNEIWALRV